MGDDRAEIAELERALAAPPTELERYRPPPPKTQAPNPDPDGRITITTERVPIVLPSETDLRRLMTIATIRFPKLAPNLNTRWAEQDEQEYFATFRSAFFWLSHVVRAEAIDKRRDADYWMMLGEQWLRAQQFHPCTLQLNLFAAAVVSQGDILYAPLDRFPCGLVFGLTGFTSPERLPGRWREVLASGRLPDPVAPK